MSICFPAIVVVHFAVIKDLVRRILNKSTFVSNISAGILCFLILTSVTILVLPFAIFRICLETSLKAIYGELYGGLLTGLDTVFELEEKDSVLINMVVIYSGKADTRTRIENFKKFVEKVHNSTYKLGCTMGNVCGYRFLIKKQVKSQDVLEIVDTNGESMSKTELYEYIEQNCSKIERKHMWKARGLLKPIHWSETTGGVNKQYVLILTFRHSLGDVPSIIGTLKRFLKDDSDISKKAEVTTIPNRPTLTLDNAYLYSNPLVRSMDGRKLKLPGRSNWYFTTYTEPAPKYLPIIKALKTKLKVAFTDVISAAIFSSVRDHISKRQVKTQTIVNYSIVRVHSQELKEIVNTTYNFKEIANTSSAVTYEIPCGMTTRGIRDTILSFHHASKILQNSADYMLLYSYMRDICSYLPTWYSRILVDKILDGTHFYLTNIVGCAKSTYEDCTIDDIFFCAPNAYNLGFVVCIFTYDHRLGISIASSRGHVHSREELQAVLDNTLKYINEAQQEIL